MRGAHAALGANQPRPRPIHTEYEDQRPLRHLPPAETTGLQRKGHRVTLSDCILVLILQEAHLISKSFPFQFLLMWPEAGSRTD